jgi:hypothetical protein
VVEDGFVVGLGLVERSWVCQPLANRVKADKQLLRGVESEEKIVALKLSK